jgi:hypothetical protein
VFIEPLPGNELTCHTIENSLLGITGILLSNPTAPQHQKTTLLIVTAVKTLVKIIENFSKLQSVFPLATIRIVAC